MPPTRHLLAIIIPLCVLPILVPAQRPVALSGRNKTGFRAGQRFRAALLTREFLEAHNKVRMNFKQPLYAWDKNLARYARRWGATRVLDCRMIHSYGPYGENLFWGAHDHWTPTDVVEAWASENKYYNAQTNACAPGEMCGHYTQIVWKDSFRLGCALIKCQSGSVLVICEYDPPGNFVNESPFGPSNESSSAPANSAATSRVPQSLAPPQTIARPLNPTNTDVLPKSQASSTPLNPGAPNGIPESPTSHRATDMTSDPIPTTNIPNGPVRITPPRWSTAGPSRSPEYLA